MKIAVMGVCGRVGKRIANEALMRGHAVVGLGIRAHEDMDPRIAFTACDLEEKEKIAAAVAGCDAYVFAVLPAMKGFDKTELVVQDSMDACKKAGIDRFLIVGGGTTLFERPGVPRISRQAKRATHKTNEKIIGSHQVILDMMYGVEDIDWVILTPPYMEENVGERTGHYRIGTDFAIQKWPDRPDIPFHINSYISMDDYAVAMLDEIEQQNHHKQRFTVGY